MEYEGGGITTKYIYQFVYNDCVFESASYTVSIHNSLEGAYKAMRKHRLNHFNEWYSFGKKYRKDLSEHNHEYWGIKKTEIMP